MPEPRPSAKDLMAGCTAMQAGGRTGGAHNSSSQCVSFYLYIDRFRERLYASVAFLLSFRTTRDKRWCSHAAMHIELTAGEREKKKGEHEERL
eukprot:scaffold9741_cov17-Tisochrysis_lutea.AAC.3